MFVMYSEYSGSLLHRLLAFSFLLYHESVIAVQDLLAQAPCFELVLELLFA